MRERIEQASRRVLYLVGCGRFEAIDSIGRLACSIIDEAALRLRLGVDLDELEPMLTDALDIVESL